MSVGNIYGGKPEKSWKSHRKTEKQRKSAGKPEKTLEGETGKS